MIVALLGLKCIKIGSTTEESKAKIAGTGGILSVLGGESAHSHTGPSPFAPGGGRAATDSPSDSCRSLLYHRRLLVRLQGGAGLLRPVLRRHEVSVRTHRGHRAAHSHLLTFLTLCGRRFELGVGLFLGWGGAALSVLGGGLLCSACRRASPPGKKGYDVPLLTWSLVISSFGVLMFLNALCFVWQRLLWKRPSEGLHGHSQV